MLTEDCSFSFGKNANSHQPTSVQHPDRHNYATLKHYYYYFLIKLDH